MCLTPAVTEIASAVRFALAGQISLSIQIGSSSAIQVSNSLLLILTLLGYHSLYQNADSLLSNLIHCLFQFFFF